MSFFKRLFSGAGSSPATRPQLKSLDPPDDWQPLGKEALRLKAFGRRVAREARDAGVARQGVNFWVVSFDVEEAIWHPPTPGSWASRIGVIRDGWSEGSCLILFEGGELACGKWHGDVNLQESVPKQGLGINEVGNLYIPNHRWGGGNLGRWRRGSSKFNPNAVETFKGFWPDPRTELPPWAGTSMQLKRFLTESRSQLPRYY